MRGLFYGLTGVNISDYLRTALLNHGLGVAAFVPPTTVYAALYTATPTSSAGGGTEVGAADYLRVATSWSLASLGSAANAAAVLFPASGITFSNWGTVQGLGLFDAPTGGNLLFFGPLSAPVLVSTGDSFQLATGALTITLN